MRDKALKLTNEHCDLIIEALYLLRPTTNGDARKVYHIDYLIAKYRKSKQMRILQEARLRQAAALKPPGLA